MVPRETCEVIHNDDALQFSYAYVAGVALPRALSVNMTCLPWAHVVISTCGLGYLAAPDVRLLVLINSQSQIVKARWN